MSDQNPTPNLPECAITNDAGLVAMKHRRLVPLNVKVNGNPYRFQDVRANINLLYVPAEDVPALMAVRGGCCGKKQTGILMLANEDDVRRWTNGGGR